MTREEMNERIIYLLEQLGVIAPINDEESQLVRARRSRIGDEQFDRIKNKVEAELESFFSE